jgi:hypothetical protein
MNAASSRTTRAPTGWKLLVCGLVLAGFLAPAGSAANDLFPPVPNFDRKTAKRFRLDLARADRHRMRPRVFAKLGDSNLGSYNTVYGLGCEPPVYGAFRGLKPVLARYRAVSLPQGAPLPYGIPAVPPCTTANSFARFSAGTRSGAFSTLLLQDVRLLDEFAFWKSDPRCLAGESMIACEIRQIRPRYSFISIGTNDESFLLKTGKAAVTRISLLVKEVRASGSIPVLSTLPPRLDLDPETDHWRYIEEMNDAILTTARQQGVAVMNPWRVLARPGMVNYGMEAEVGLHLETWGGHLAPDALRKSVDFRPAALRYGNNRRNLLLLRTLKRLDREVRSVRRAAFRNR